MAQQEEAHLQRPIETIHLNVPQIQTSEITPYDNMTKSQIGLKPCLLSLFNYPRHKYHGNSKISKYKTWLFFLAILIVLK